jgi:type 1 glutamine amidotransferase
MRVIIATGTGRYADPWHPFEETSQRLAELLSQDSRIDIQLDADVDHAMEHAAAYDLVVVNAGDPWREDGRSVVGRQIDGAPAASVHGLADAIAAGTGFLGMHTAVATLRDYPQWAPLCGAIWLPGVSWHPPKGELMITVPEAGAPDTGPAAGPSQFAVTDELYLQLQRVGDHEVVAESGHDAVRHPVAWTRNVGAARAAIDVLGHGPESYDSEGHRRLVTALAWWAARTA